MYFLRVFGVLLVEVVAPIENKCKNQSPMHCTAFIAKHKAHPKLPDQVSTLRDASEEMLNKVDGIDV